MLTIITGLANTAGILGVALCLISGLSRISGNSHLMGYEALTLFNGGVGLMVFAILVKMESAGRQRS